MLTAVPLGLAIGVALGALGGGGSILTVPALVYVLGQDPRTATTSSLVIVGLTSLIALGPHARARRVRFAEGAIFGALGTAGSLAGSALSRSVPSTSLLAAFAVLMLLVAAVMLHRARRPVVGAGPPAQPATGRSPTISGVASGRTHLAKVVVAASAVGLLTGFFGVGGGFVLVPALVLTLRFSMPVAVGTSLLVIAINSATALAARIGDDGGGLDWWLIGVFTTAAVAGSLAGGRITSRVDPRHLTMAFAVLLVLVALYTGVRSFGAV